MNIYPPLRDLLVAVLIKGGIEFLALDLHGFAGMPRVFKKLHHLMSSLRFNPKFYSHRCWKLKLPQLTIYSQLIAS